MATLNPEAQGSIYIPEPVATPSALGAIGNIVGFAADAMKAKNAVQSSGAYKAAADQARLVGLQDGLYKAQELKKQGKKAQGESIERQVILNFARDGGDLGDASVKQTILLSTGKSMEQAGRTPEEIANQQFMESPDYGPLVLAGMYELGPDKTSQDYHKYAVTQKARQEALKVTLQDTSISWLEGKQQAFTDTISMFQKTSLGALQLAATTQGFVTREDFLSAQQQWNVLKKDLTASRPVGLEESQWKPVKDQMDLMDETLTLLSGLAGTSGIEATLMSEFANGLMSATREGKLSTFEASAIISAVKQNGIETIRDFGVTDSTRIREIILSEQRVTIPEASEQPIPDEVKDQYKNVDAATKFRDAAALTKNQAGSTALRPETYNHITVDHLTKAFGAMQSVANDNGQFVSIDGINKVFNGGVVSSIKEVGKTAPDTARKLADAGFEALDSQYAVAVGALTSIVEGSGLGFDRGTGQLVISPESLSALGVPSDRVTLLNSLANQYYGGDMVAMVKDRGRAFRGSTSPEARQGAALVTSGTLGNMTTVIERAQQQEKVVRRLDTLRNDFRTLGDSFVDTNIQGGAGTDQAKGGADQDRLGPYTDGLSLLREFEGFSDKAYWDVNAYRTGYGSDTITKADGTVVRVTKDTKVTREDAERDLSRRWQEFYNKAGRQVGREIWTSLPSNITDALTSVTYNYGSLPKNVVAAVQTGTPEEIAQAVEALGNHNEGVNRRRRYREAAIIRGEAREPSVAPVVSARPVERPRDVQMSAGAADVSVDTPNAPQVASTPQSEVPQRYTQATPQEVEQLSQQTKSMLERLQVNPESLKSFKNGEDMLRAYKEGQIQDGEFILLGGEVFEV